MNLALCKCGIDMTEHDDVDPWEYPVEPIPEGGHAFDPAGTKHRCEELIEYSMPDMKGRTAKMTFLCPRPAYHKEEGVECGPLTGNKLW